MTITTGSDVRVRRLTGSVGAEVQGVDLAHIDDATFAAVHSPLLEHGVIVLRDQELTPETHKAFRRRFGELHTHPAAPGPEGHPEILLLENHGKDELEGMRAVIRTHPESGRRALFVNAGFTRRFEDMTVAESRPLLRYLVEVATTPDLVYRHVWDAGDVVMWDNRGVMHFAIHDYDDQHRVMHRVTVQGDEPR